MSNINDFVIENGVLKGYTGTETEVDIPSIVTSIDYNAFFRCTSITSITIPDSVISIRYGAFAECTSLTSITIPASVTSIEQGAFRYCPALTNIEVDEGNKYYKSIDGNLYDKIGKTLIVYAMGKKGTFVIPKSVTQIGDCFWHCSAITSVIIPESVESICDCVIDRCDSIEFSLKYSNLKKITWLSNNFLKLPSDAKLLCALGFVEADYKGEVIENDVRNAYLKYIKSQRKKLYPLMSQNTALFYYMLKNKVVAKEYLNDIFAEVQVNGDTEKMAAILPLISSEKKQSDDFEFGGVSLDLSTAEAKKNWAFDNTDVGVKITAYKGKETVVTVPDSIGGKPVVTIGEYAFSPEKPRVVSSLKPYLKSIVEVVLPLSVTRIENNAFEECASIEKITVPPDLAFIGELAFKNCKVLASFEMQAHR